VKIVSVIGSSTVSKDSDEYIFAYELGKELAKRNFIVCSGGRTGIMEAVSKGAKEQNGLTIGIMPSYTGEEANPYVDIKINTGMNWNRNPIVVATGIFVIAISGGYGTLSELAYSQILKKKVFGYKTHDIEGVEKVSTLEELLQKIDEYLRIK